MKFRYHIFIFFLILITHAVPVSADTETSEMSPYKDGRIPVLDDQGHEIVSYSDYMERDPVTGETILNMSPYIIRPHMSPEESIREYIRKNFSEFNAQKMWQEKYKRELRGTDLIFNSHSIPFIGTSGAEMARMHALDHKLEKHINQMELFESAGNEIDKDTRLEIFKMKRDAIQIKGAGSIIDRAN